MKNSRRHAKETLTEFKEITLLIMLSNWCLYRSNSWS